MKDQSTFTPSDFFVFRTPLLPFKEFLKWSEDLSAPQALADPAQLAEALERDCTRLRSQLKAVIARSDIRDALFVASPNIIERFHLWTDDPTSERGRKVEQVLVRYFSRMTARATPFGLFAGVSVGKTGQQTALRIEGHSNYQRHTRLDMDYLFALTDALSREPTLSNAFTFRPNNSIYHAAGRMRYVESRLDDKTRSYHLVTVEETDYLAATLARAHEGATPEQLAAALVDDEVSLEEARTYIAQLIESQILVPEIALNVSGPEPIHPLIEKLREHDETYAMAETLARVCAELSLIDRDGLGVEPERYRAVARSLESLPAKADPSRLFQVDMLKPAPDATLGRAALDEIMRGVNVLHRLASGPGIQDALARFREAFVARYEERDVPLVEALDEEIGIGFGDSDETTPLLKELLFPPIREESVPVNERHTILLGKLSEALQSGAHEINLEPHELERMETKDRLPLPDAFAVSATLAASSQEALTRGDFRVFVQTCAGPSGAVLLGRFCHADQRLEQYVRHHLQDEEALEPDAVFAEIVHLPEGRIGNVISRPMLRDHEIPYLGFSLATEEHQIPVADLRVFVRGGRIHLRSARIGREVIPRLTNAHNYGWRGLGIYKFLCMLQHQGLAAGLGWDWGALESAPFLPRVTMGRLVLALARWRASREELRALGRQRGAARFCAVQNWRAARRLPRLIGVADADNILLIDFDNALSVESFVSLVKERESAVLVESFPAPEQLCASGPEGLFVHELIIPFVKSKAEDVRLKDERSVAVTESHSLGRRVAALKRRFPPGSEWLYAKLYTGTATADHLLRDALGPFIADALHSGAAEQWFFIRYGDPEWHLRLRFHGSPERLHAEVMPALQSAVNPLLDDGRLWRVQFDTYEREVERYGGAEGILLAERLFHIDSEAALEIIEMLEPGDTGADERWRLTLSGVDLLLKDFGFDLKSRCALLKRARESFGREFRVDKTLLGQLSDKFRKERHSLAALLGSTPDSEHPLAPGLLVFNRRSDNLATVIAELKRCERDKLLSVSLPELMLSFIHMHANRLLRSAQRQQELVIYDLLARLYESQLARVEGDK